VELALREILNVSDPNWGETPKVFVTGGTIVSGADAVATIDLLVIIPPFYYREFQDFDMRFPDATFPADGDTSAFDNEFRQELKTTLGAEATAVDSLTITYSAGSIIAKLSGGWQDIQSLCERPLDTVVVSAQSVDPVTCPKPEVDNVAYSAAVEQMRAALTRLGADGLYLPMLAEELNAQDIPGDLNLVQVTDLANAVTVSQVSGVVPSPPAVVVFAGLEDGAEGAFGTGGTAPGGLSLGMVNGLAAAGIVLLFGGGALMKRRKLRDVAGETTLKVTIVGATGLRDADLISGMSDAYCVCQVPGRSGFKFRTNWISGDLNPQWNKEVIVDGFLSEDMLQFSVFDRDRFKHHDLLGMATLKGDDILPDGFKGALPLSGLKATGEVNVIIEVMDVQGEDVKKKVGDKLAMVDGSVGLDDDCGSSRPKRAQGTEPEGEPSLVSTPCVHLPGQVEISPLWKGTGIEKLPVPRAPSRLALDALDSEQEQQGLGGLPEKPPSPPSPLKETVVLFDLTPKAGSGSKIRMLTPISQPPEPPVDDVDSLPTEVLDRRPSLNKDSLQRALNKFVESVQSSLPNSVPQIASRPGGEREVCWDDGEAGIRTPKSKPGRPASARSGFSAPSERSWGRQQEDYWADSGRQTPSQQQKFKPSELQATEMQLPGQTPFFDRLLDEPVRIGEEDFAVNAILDLRLVKVPQQSQHSGGSPKQRSRPETAPLVRAPAPLVRARSESSAVGSLCSWSQQQEGGYWGDTGSQSPAFRRRTADRLQTLDSAGSNRAYSTGSSGSCGGFSSESLTSMRKLGRSRPGSSFSQKPIQEDMDGKLRMAARSRPDTGHVRVPHIIPPGASIVSGQELTEALTLAQRADAKADFLYQKLNQVQATHPISLSRCRSEEPNWEQNWDDSGPTVSQRATSQRAVLLNAEAMALEEDGMPMPKPTAEVRRLQYDLAEESFQSPYGNAEAITSLGKFHSAITSIPEISSPSALPWDESPRRRWSKSPRGLGAGGGDVAAAAAEEGPPRDARPPRMSDSGRASSRHSSAPKDAEFNTKHVDIWEKDGFESPRPASRGSNADWSREQESYWVDVEGSQGDTGGTGASPASLQRALKAVHEKHLAPPRSVLDKPASLLRSVSIQSGHYEAAPPGSLSRGRSEDQLSKTSGSKVPKRLHSLLPPPSLSRQASNLSLAVSDKLFDKIDKNGDGIISAEELAEAMSGGLLRQGASQPHLGNTSSLTSESGWKEETLWQKEETIWQDGSDPSETLRVEPQHMLDPTADTLRLGGFIPGTSPRAKSAFLDKDAPVSPTLPVFVEDQEFSWHTPDESMAAARTMKRQEKFPGAPQGAFNMTLPGAVPLSLDRSLSLPGAVPPSLDRSLSKEQRDGSLYAEDAPRQRRGVKKLPPRIPGMPGLPFPQSAIDEVRRSSDEAAARERAAVERKASKEAPVAARRNQPTKRPYIGNVTFEQWGEALQERAAAFKGGGGKSPGGSSAGKLSSRTWGSQQFEWDWEGGRQTPLSSPRSPAGPAGKLRKVSTPKSVTADRVLPQAMPFAPKTGHAPSLHSALSARSWSQAVEPFWDGGQQPAFGLAPDAGFTAMEFDVGSMASGREPAERHHGVGASLWSDHLESYWA